MPTDPKSGATATERRPTSVTEWKRTDLSQQTDVSDSEGFIVDLPSGNCVMMKRDLSMPTMLSTGNIPNPLAGIVRTMIDSGSKSFTPSQVEGYIEDPRVVMQLLDLCHETIVRCVISPPFAMPAARGKLMGNDGKRVKETPEEYQERLAEWECPDDHISVWAMDMEDRFFIFSVAQGAAADLATFREEQERTVADVQASQGVRKPTKRTGGARSKK